MNELNPCPFCGSRGAVEDFDSLAVALVQCMNPECAAEGPTREKAKEAIAAWNTRTPQAEEEK